MINIEKNTDVKIKCYKCGNEYTMAMMRVEPKSSNLTCRNCLDRKPVQKQEQTTKPEAKGATNHDKGKLSES